MKIRGMVVVSAALSLGLAGCGKPETEIPEPMLEVSCEILEFAADGETKTIEITANNAWSLEVRYPDETVAGEGWLSVAPSEGEASEEPLAVAVTASENNGGGRTAVFTVTSGELVRTVEVSQAEVGIKTFSLSATVEDGKWDETSAGFTVNASDNLEWTLTVEGAAEADITSGTGTRDVHLSFRSNNTFASQIYKVTVRTEDEKVEKNSLEYMFIHISKPVPKKFSLGGLPTAVIEGEETEGQFEIVADDDVYWRVSAESSDPSAALTLKYPTEEDAPHGILFVSYACNQNDTDEAITYTFTITTDNEMVEEKTLTYVVTHLVKKVYKPFEIENGASGAQIDYGASSGSFNVIAGDDVRWRAEVRSSSSNYIAVTFPGTDGTSGPQSVNFACQPNETGSDFTYTFTISTDDTAVEYSTLTYVVTHKAKPGASKLFKIENDAAGMDLPKDSQEGRFQIVADADVKWSITDVKSSNPSAWVSAGYPKYPTQTTGSGMASFYCSPNNSGSDNTYTFTISTDDPAVENKTLTFVVTHKG